MTLYDVVKLILTFLGAAATPVAALPDDMLPIWGKVAAVAVGSACVATLAQLDKLGHRHPSVTRHAPDRSPFAANDVPLSDRPPAPRPALRVPTPPEAVLTEPGPARGVGGRRPRPRPMPEDEVDL